MRTVLLLMILLPFAGAGFLAIVGRYVPRRLAEAVACGAVLGSLVLAATAFLVPPHGPEPIVLFRWIGSAGLAAPMSLHYDPLAGVMTLMVTLVASLIHLYSIAFMADEKGYLRFFSYMNLFVFAMLVVTLADNLLFFYLGWEGVGFCSYGLIGFWYDDSARATAGRKAFVLTRIGDVALGLAIALCFALSGGLSLSGIQGFAPSMSTGAATLLGLLLLWAAVGKSAQLPLTVWLPDAMAGPTPVSALIHAATMVTAGVYLLLRFYPVLAASPAVLLVTASVGAVTAFYGACSALSQRDIKRALAYSTMSQVSYMFMAVGAGDPAAGTFHLLSHAFFKALLFLAAGCVIQALGEEHDLFRMGGLRKRLPLIYWPFLAGTLSLAAFPLTGGFFSKDRILLALLGHPEPVYRFLAGLAAATSLLTALYAFRLFFMVFLGEPAETKGRKLGRIPGLMIWPLWVLAALSLAAGLLNLPEAWSGREWLARSLVPVAGFPLPAAVPDEFEWGLAAGSALIVLAMAMVARRFFLPPSTAALPPAVDALLLNGFYLDRLYHAALAKPYRAMSLLLWQGIDEAVVDGTVEGGARLFLRSSLGLRRWTNGRISTYLTMLWLGLAGILCLLAVTWYAGG